MNITSYMNADELLAASHQLASSYPALCTYEDAPVRSVEGRTIPQLRISGENPDNKPVLLVTAGLHAREWVSPDALIYFLADLLAAYSDNTGLSYGNARYSAADIQSILANWDIVAFPSVNPDGRKYSQEVWYHWRGNRRVVIKDGRESFGVDLNRNFNFVWDFKKDFHPDIMPASDDPFLDRQTYHGTAPNSEPEARNIVSAMDRFPVALFVDLHSFSPTLLHSWGHEQSQSENSTMNFQNAIFDGKRGLPDDPDYSEFHPATDSELSQSISARVAQAIKRVQGIDYPPQPAFNLYPTSGAVDDYAYSRKFQLPSGERILAFTLESGDEFQPKFPKALGVMKEVAVALMEFALSSPEQATS